MNTHRRTSHPIYLFSQMEIEGFDALAELSLKLRSTWNHATDPKCGDSLIPHCGFTHNPVGC